MQVHRRAISLGGVVFNYPLFIKEFEEPDDILAVEHLSSAGSHIVFTNRLETPYITLLSKESGWTDIQTVELLKGLCSNVGNTLELKYENGDLEQVRIAHELKPQFKELFECSDQFLIILPLAKI